MWQWHIRWQIGARMTAAALGIVALSVQTIQAQPASPQFVPGEVVVRFRSGSVDLPEGKVTASVSEVSATPTAAELLSASGTTDVVRVFRRFSDPHDTRMLQDGTTVAVGGMSNVFRLIVPTSTDVSQLSETLMTSDAVVYAEPNYLVYADDALPNDVRFSDQWGLRQIPNDADVDAPAAWEVGTGTETVRLGVIDTGVYYQHQDLGEGFGTGLKVAGVTCPHPLVHFESQNQADLEPICTASGAGAR